MLPIDFGAYALWQNLAVFLFAAAIIWAAGSRLAIYADIIADRSGLGHALVGLVLLAGATSLPEIGRTISAAAIGSTALVVDSLFGGIVLQTAILGLADFSVAQQVLTFFAPSSVLLLEGALVILLLSLALSGIAAGELFSFFNVGVWSFVLMGVYVLALYLLQAHEGRGWVPIAVPEELKREEEERPSDHHLKSNLEIGLRLRRQQHSDLSSGDNPGPDWRRPSCADRLGGQFRGSDPSRLRQRASRDEHHHSRGTAWRLQHGDL